MRFIVILFFLLVSLNIYSQADNKKVTALVQKAYQHFYSNQDSAYFYFEQIKTIATQEDDVENILLAHISINRVASYFYNLEKMKSNLETVEQLLKVRSKAIDSLENSHVYKNSVLFDQGIYRYEINDFKTSKTKFNSLINGLEKIPDSIIDRANVDLLSQSYNYIAKMLADEERFKDAEQYYNKNIRYINANKPDDLKNLNKTYSLLAEVLRKENNHEQSNFYFIKALQYQIDNKGNTNSIVSASENIIENHITLKQKDSAYFYLNVLKENLTENHPFWYKYYNAFAEIKQSENNYIQAREALNSGLNSISGKGKNTNDFDVANQYFLLGNLDLEFNNLKEALINYDLAHDSIKNSDHKAVNQTLIFRILKRKIEVFNKESNFLKSIQSVDQAITILDDLKPGFKNTKDKLFLIESAFPVFESGIEACYNLYQTTKQDSLTNKAFHYSEKSKSVLLLEALLSTKANDFSNIPKEISEKEQILKSEINRIEKKLILSNKKSFEDQLFQLKTEYRNLISTIETNYKNYYDLKYNSDVITINHVQDLLHQESTLISYFYGNKAIYALAISKNSKQIMKYELDENIENDIRAIYKMLHTPASDLQTLNDYTYKFYKKLVAPSLENKVQKNLIIIPDGLLNYIPFSSVNTNKNEAKYLIEDYSVSYINSATLMQQLSGNKVANNEVLAFAPSFSNASSNLLPLPNNDTEAKDILNYFQGKVLTNNQATLKNFNAESDQYGILHFATHAVLNDETPKYSYLAFQPNDTNSNLLYVSDLYNLNLNTNLITLSACESGIGDLNRGEGFMSLARGFYFSGASSISSTLWKINDASSLKIMNAFYKNLSQSKTKNLALQNAKLEFINANRQNALIHPYYWSGFIISGNTIAVTSQNNWTWYMFGAIILILLGVAYKKRRRST